MFLPIELQSVNQVSQLECGEYLASRRTYVSRDRSTTMLNFEYTLSGDDVAAACDIVLVGKDGALHACDFVRMADRSWRDSSGARSDSLLALLPAEVDQFELVEEEAVGSFHVAETV